MGELRNGCPTCGRVNELHSSTTNPANRPESGDLSLCWGCHEPAIFEINALGATMLRKPTPAERAEIDADPDVAKALERMARSRTPDQVVVESRSEAADA